MTTARLLHLCRLAPPGIWLGMRFAAWVEAVEPIMDRDLTDRPWDRHGLGEGPLAAHVYEGYEEAARRLPIHKIIFGVVVYPVEQFWGA